VNGRDRMDLGMEDIEENIQHIMDDSHKLLPNLFAKIGFRVEMAKVAKERMYSNYFEIVVHKLEILN